MSPRLAVTVTFETDNLDAVRDWLDEHCDLHFNDDVEAFCAYIRHVVLSNSEWDNVDV